MACETRPGQVGVRMLRQRRAVPRPTTPCCTQGAGATLAPSAHLRAVRSSTRPGARRTPRLVASSARSSRSRAPDPPVQYGASDSCYTGNVVFRGRKGSTGIGGSELQAEDGCCLHNPWPKPTRRTTTRPRCLTSSDVHPVLTLAVRECATNSRGAAPATPVTGAQDHWLAPPARARSGRTGRDLTAGISL